MEENNSFRMRRLQYDDFRASEADSSCDDWRNGCCRWCGCRDIVCGIPKWSFILSIALFTVIYGTDVGYTVWNIRSWDDICNDWTKEYVFMSTILLVASLSGGCFVGAHVGDRNVFVTILALLVDLVMLGMIVWGAVQWVTRTRACDAALRSEQPQLFFFWKVTFFYWIFHSVLVVMMINCWGRLKRNTIRGI